jgi:hypothetical protein
MSLFLTVMFICIVLSNLAAEQMKMQLKSQEEVNPVQSDVIMTEAQISNKQLSQSVFPEVSIQYDSHPQTNGNFYYYL